MAEKHQTTPLPIIGERYPYELGFDVQLPLHENYHYGIIEYAMLPDEVGFPEASPRTYWVRDVPWAGNHAHKPNSEREMMICLDGQVDIHLWNSDGQRYVRRLIAPTKEGDKDIACFVPEGIWHLVRAVPPSLLLVAASVSYDRSYYQEDPVDYFTPEGLKVYNQTVPRRLF